MDTDERKVFFIIPTKDECVITIVYDKIVATRIIKVKHGEKEEHRLMIYMEGVIETFFLDDIYGKNLARYEEFKAGHLNSFFV